ncbi:MAG: CehA/McbA family metallohydrolase [Chloroflexi bacterium]|nr:CehA/McbA family metallohydrolase [Chloroflexota bacterium]
MRNRWYKGNLHTHTSLLGSTGPESPENVVRWYGSHGYHWLAITDHNVLTEYETDELVMVRGQEVGKHMPSGNGPIHVNGFGIESSVEFVDLDEKVPTMQASIDGVLAVGGMASLNHPNDRDSFTHEHVLQTTGASFVEVFNGGGPSKNNEGGDGRPNTEEIWDSILSGGQRIYGIATDDAHTYDEFRPDRANPGRGWVWIRARTLVEETILEALSLGEFYASTGVELTDVSATPSDLSIKIQENPGESFDTRFIGRNGRVLAEQVGLQPRYVFEGDEGYVRATVLSSTGSKAWVQPVFLTSYE